MKPEDLYLPVRLPGLLHHTLPAKAVPNMSVGKRGDRLASAQSGQQRFVRRRLQVDEDEDLSLIVRMQTGQFPAHPPTQISPSHRCSGACGILEEDAHAVGKRFQGLPYPAGILCVL